MIRAPFDGVVVRKRTELGQWLQLGGDVAEMIALDTLDVHVEVPESYYREIAEGVGSPNAFRAVGQANHHNPIPIIIPCHRVVGADGTLTGFGGGLPVKRALLALELGTGVESQKALFR